MRLSLNLTKEAAIFDSRLFCFYPPDTYSVKR